MLKATELTKHTSHAINKWNVDPGGTSNKTVPNATFQSINALIVTPSSGNSMASKLFHSHKSL